ncbi:MAG TPA: hypothetical protein VHC72_03900 [Bryobacteraceae bacterium]|nr:hypothetical protein [Bryobacteraceae bacterium]
MKPAAGILVILAAILPAAAPQNAEEAKIERHGDSAVISVHTFRPLEAIADELGSEFGIPVSAEDPVFQFRGDMMDISREVPRLRPGTLAPARWGFQITFPLKPDGSPRDPQELLTGIVAEANRQSPFGWRLDKAEGVYFFVPTRTHDANGQSVAATALLDRPVTIPPGIRRINESAELMANDLSKQTGLRVSCCQGPIGGYPWGMEQMPFSADHEPARSVLLRLGLRRWHASCDLQFCFINKQ